MSIVDFLPQLWQLAPSKRHKGQMSGNPQVRISKGRAAQLDQWLSRQAVPLTRNAVVELALRLFLQYGEELLHCERVEQENRDAFERVQALTNNNEGSSSTALELTTEQLSILHRISKGWKLVNNSIRLNKPRWIFYPPSQVRSDDFEAVETYAVATLLKQFYLEREENDDTDGLTLTALGIANLPLRELEKPSPQQLRTLHRMASGSSLTSKETLNRKNRLVVKYHIDGEEIAQNVHQALASKVLIAIASQSDTATIWKLTNRGEFVSHHYC